MASKLWSTLKTIEEQKRSDQLHQEELHRLRNQPPQRIVVDSRPVKLPKARSSRGLTIMLFLVFAALIGLSAQFFVITKEYTSRIDNLINNMGKLQTSYEKNNKDVKETLRTVSGIEDDQKRITDKLNLVSVKVTELNSLNDRVAGLEKMKQLVNNLNKRAIATVDPLVVNVKVYEELTKAYNSLLRKQALLEFEVEQLNREQGS